MLKKSKHSLTSVCFDQLVLCSIFWDQKILNTIEQTLGAGKTVFMEDLCAFGFKFFRLLIRQFLVHMFSSCFLTSVACDVFKYSLLHNSNMNTIYW